MANGILDPLVAEQLARVPTEVVPSVPDAWPHVGKSPLGCAGPHGRFGYIASPKGAADVNCPIQVHASNPWSLTLTCASASVAESRCFAFIAHLDFVFFGIYQITCFATAGASFGAVSFQQGETVTTPGCTIFSFGIPPSQWFTWYGAGGGLGGPGAWDATVLDA